MFKLNEVRVVGNGKGAELGFPTVNFFLFPIWG